MAAETEGEMGDSILTNISKTRELWSSKAEVTADVFIPKPQPLVTKASLTNGATVKNDRPIEVVRADEQVVEDYDLPDIRAMKSQYDAGKNAKIPLPMPTLKSPAIAAREREKNEKKQMKAENLVPVNREEKKEENFNVEMGQLKAKWEAAAAAPAPVVSKTSVSRSASIRSHTSADSRMSRTSESDSHDLDIVRQPNGPTEDIKYEVELSALKKRFESANGEPAIVPKPQTGIKRTPSMNASRPIRTQVEGGDADESALSAPVKSSEPLYEAMVGEESVKDRLKKFKSLAESGSDTTPPPSYDRPPSIKRNCHVSEARKFFVLREEKYREKEEY